MNVCLFVGRLSSDVEHRVNGEHQSATFSIAVDRKTKDRKTDFFRMVAFGKNAENINKFFHKGSRIAVHAQAVKPDKYTDRNGQTRYPDIEFWVNSFDFIDTKAESGNSAPATAAPTSAPQSTASEDFMSIAEGCDTELPFS